MLIEWEDSGQPVSDWTWLSSYQPPVVVRCTSVGWLVHEDESVIALAQSIADADTDSAQIAGIMRIPVRSITCRLILRGDPQ